MTDRGYPYGCLVMTGFRTDGYPGAPWLWNCSAMGSVVDCGGGRACRCRWGAGFERVARLAGLAFEMAQDAVDDPGLGDEGDDLHLGTAATEQRVNLEDFSQQAGERKYASSSRSRIPGRLAPEVARSGVLPLWYREQNGLGWRRPRST